MKDILLSVLFILALLFISYVLFEWKEKKCTKKTMRISIFLLSLLSIIFCLTFSINLSEQYSYDLRAIPFILGGLYGGPIVSVGLYLTIIISRLIIGGIDLGFLGAVCNNGLLTIILCLLSKRFLNARTSIKVYIINITVILHILLSLMTYLYLFEAHVPVELFIKISLIKFITINLILLTIERMHQNYLMRKKMEEIEKMELISHLSASIAHEVRNGLTGAHGFLQLLNDVEEDKQKRKYISIALTELQNTEDIIRDFLTFAKPVPEPITPINIKSLIQNTIKIITPLANKNAVEIKANLSSFWLKGEERLIQQSMLNVLKNAIEAMPNGGELKINMSRSMEEQVITIKDTGIGMTQEQVERLGKPYFTTKNQKGTGLGMMVAFRVIERLKGKIIVRSEVGKGSEIIIFLPYTE